MKYSATLLTILFSLAFLFADAQTGNSYSKRDSVQLAKLNSSGNLMIAGGVGLCAAGGYLLYQGISVYRTRDNSGTPSALARNEQNKKQGTVYLVAAGVGIAGGVVLTAFGARNKVDFKRRKKAMEASLEFFPKGQVGLALNF